MATAAVGSAMSVHPFFAKTYRMSPTRMKLQHKVTDWLAIGKPQATEADESPKVGHVANESSTNASTEQAAVIPPLAGKFEDTKPVKHQEQSNSNVAIEPTEVKSGTRENQQTVGARDEDDANEDRRKRIKLSPAWNSAENLQNAALDQEQLNPGAHSGLPSAPKSAEESALDEETTEAQLPSIPSTPPPRIMDRVEIGVVSACDTFREQQTGDDAKPEYNLPHSQEFKPKKMLRLRPNGKFSSPPRKASPERLESTQRGRRQKADKKQLMAVWKYPSASNGDQLGQKIDQILGGAERVTDLKAKENSTNRSPKKPTGPPKSTHPFFLGKALRAELQQDQPKVTSSPSKRSPSQANSPSRRRATATPVKPKARIQLPQATVESSRAPLFGSSRPTTGFTKHPGSRDAPWPDSENHHVRGDIETSQEPQAQNKNVPLEENGKKTRAAVFIPSEENIISRYADQLRYSDHDRSKVLRKARRELISGPEIQNRVFTELCTMLDDTDTEMPDGDNQYPYLRSIYFSIGNYLTPFDKFECEQQLWIQKYAPQKAEEVLQQGPEVIILRDWLRQCTVTSVDTGTKGSTASLDISKKSVAKPAKKRKRKRAEDLDDFIVSSEDEGNELDDLRPSSSGQSASRSLIRGGLAQPGQQCKVGNAILLSGPHGCGKTAAVYAVAKELGFEVFELNSASRRSGKDVLDKIGDMTENHLVQQVAKALSESKTEKDLKPVEVEAPKDEPDPRQKSMASFFKPVGHKKTSPASKKPASKPSKESSKPDKTRPQQKQKQSLILLEEVDVLYEEDKQFWVTVLTLAKHSKRPIVITCNDENLVPLDALTVHAILRFTPPPADLAGDYLMLLAAREGHLFGRYAVTALYEATDHDLRASIMELNFWCQMGVGAENCLEWLYQRWPKGSDVDEQGRPLRVVSEDTYSVGLGFYGQEVLHSNGPESGLEQALQEAQREWDISSDDLKQFEWIPEKLTPGHPSTIDVSEATFYSDSLSAADIYSSTRHSSNPTRLSIDPSLPELTEKVLASYPNTADYRLLQADPPPAYTNLDSQLSTSALGLAYPDLMSDATAALYSHNDRLVKAAERSFVEVLLSSMRRQSQPTHFTRRSFSCLDVLIQPESSQSLSTSGISSLDREFRVITTDLAPYIRSIAAYDLHLEEQRLKLSHLLSAGGRAKRLRTTRAARSAAEGGRREETRRERWFDKELNLRSVMETGGKEWAGMGGRAEELQKRTEEDTSIVSTAQSAEQSPSP